MAIASNKPVRRISCSEIWGGTRDIDVDAATGGLLTSIYSRACDGGRGGDIYYISVCNADMLTRIAVADVVGHGEAVNQVGEWVYQVLAAQINNPDADEFLSTVNQQVVQRGFEALTTAAIASFHKFESHLYVSYAGHPPLLMCRRGQRHWEVVGVRSLTQISNLPLGVEKDVQFLQDQVQMASGDRLFAYTDGLVDIPSPQGEMFGQERLLAVLEAACDRPLAELKHAVVQAAEQHAGGSFSHDDVTLMAVEIR